MTEVCSPQRKLIPDTEDWERHELTSLRGIAYKAKTKPDDRFRDLSRCIDETLLGYCFGKLNKKSGHRRGSSKLWKLQGELRSQHRGLNQSTQTERVSSQAGKTQAHPKRGREDEATGNTRARR
ncbi:MAG: hypothetical protein P8179_24895 [Candidatus Thiodiazotropha sp.]